MPLSQRLIDAENAHKLAIWAGRHNLLFSKRIKVEDGQILVSHDFKANFLIFDVYTTLFFYLETNEYWSKLKS